MFLHTAAMAFIINVLGVLIFAGLIAYDTQRLKMTYYQLGGDQAGHGRGDQLRRAQPLPRLHQPVPIPAAA